MGLSCYRAGGGRAGYAWGKNTERAVLGESHVAGELVPAPVVALRGLRVSSIAVTNRLTKAVAINGEVWAWGITGTYCPFGPQGMQTRCSWPMPFESLRGVKVDAVAVGSYHMLALADDGSVYAWGDWFAASACDPRRAMPVPQRIPGCVWLAGCDGMRCREDMPMCESAHAEGRIHNHEYTSACDRGAMQPYGAMLHTLHGRCTYGQTVGGGGGRGEPMDERRRERRRARGGKPGSAAAMLHVGRSCFM
jgi:hypothetical protein